MEYFSRLPHHLLQVKLGEQVRAQAKHRHKPSMMTHRGSVSDGVSCRHPHAYKVCHSVVKKSYVRILRCSHLPYSDPSMKIKYNEVTKGTHISILKCQSSTNWQRVQRGECIFTRWKSQGKPAKCQYIINIEPNHHMELGIEELSSGS